uniref:Vacuolar protein sorting-associated protein 35 n=1 Tax=Peronospora matthiolae TaxID=2874970 RepID=A0AAV1UMV0_9STRA
MTIRPFVLDEQGERDVLCEALRTVRDQGLQMQRAFKAQEQAAGINFAAEVLRELRTSLLCPRNYYQLYMQAVEQLRHFESYVEEQEQAGASMCDLYERVQSSSKVLPRLYLLVTVGAVYIKSRETPAREVLTDLVEMIKGVQHPLRGLFLRHYLSLSIRDKLPDKGSVYEQCGGGSFGDAIQFLLQNLQETNQLWIRLQQQKAGGSRPQAVWEKEVMELRLLVGTSLVRLSQLNGVTRSVYTDQVLPRLLDDVVLACNDSLAQQYLMDCIIQVFPDEFHFDNLERLLGALEKLQSNVNVALILTALVERLTSCQEAQGSVTGVGQQEGGVDECSKIEYDRQDGFEVFQRLMTTTIKVLLRSLNCEDRNEVALSEGDGEDVNINLTSVLSLFVALVNFAIAWLDGVTDESSRLTTALEQVLYKCLTFLHEQKPWCVDEQRRHAVLLAVKSLLLALFRTLSIHNLLQVPSLLDVLGLMPWGGERKDVALIWIRVLLARQERIIDEKQITFVLTVLAPVVHDDPNEVRSLPLTGSTTTTGTQKDADVLEMEQHTLAKVVHLVENGDPDVRFRVFKVARRALVLGGVYRIRYTLLPLIYQSLALARELAIHWQERSQTLELKRKAELEATVSEKGTKNVVTTPREVLQFVHEMVTVLVSQNMPSVSCVQLYLQCALVADGCAFETVACEFITQALTVYEDHITLAREQLRAFELIVASLRATCNLSSANYEALATKVTQYSAHLPRKNEQASMVLKCAHLFWHPCQKDGKRVRECLQRSLRIADSLKDVPSKQIPLFLDILEAYLSFFEMQTPEVTLKYLVGLSALIKDHLDTMEHGLMRKEGEVRYRAIESYMEAMMDTCDDVPSSPSSQYEAK